MKTVNKEKPTNEENKEEIIEVAEVKEEKEPKENKFIKFGKAALNKAQEGLNEVIKYGTLECNKIKDQVVKAYENYKNSKEFNEAYEKRTIEFDIVGVFTKLGQQVTIKAIKYQIKMNYFLNLI